MLPLKLKKTPTFDIEKDIEQIAESPAADHESLAPQVDQLRTNVLPFPSYRAYILDEEMEPIAIFDLLGYEEVGVFIRLLLCHCPEPLKNPDNNQYLEVANTLRDTIRNSARFYEVALFQADKVAFHFLISVDLVVFLCGLLADWDIVDQRFWDFLAGYPEGL